MRVEGCRLQRKSHCDFLQRDTNIKSIEEVVARLLVLNEDLQVLEDPLLDGHLIEVPDAVLTEEVELHHTSENERIAFDKRQSIVNWKRLYL